MGSHLIVFCHFFFKPVLVHVITFFFLGLIEFEECDPASVVEGKLTSCNVWQLADSFCLLNREAAAHWCWHVCGVM